MQSFSRGWFDGLFCILVYTFSKWARKACSDENFSAEFEVEMKKLEAGQFSELDFFMIDFTKEETRSAALVQAEALGWGCLSPLESRGLERHLQIALSRLQSGFGC